MEDFEKLSYEDFENLMLNSYAANQSLNINFELLKTLKLNEAVIYSLMLKYYDECGRIPFTLPIKEIGEIIILGRDSIMDTISKLVNLQILKKVRFGNDQQNYYVPLLHNLQEYLKSHRKGKNQTCSSRIFRPSAKSDPVGNSDLDSSLIIYHSTISNCKSDYIDSSYSHAHTCMHTHEGEIEEVEKKSDADLDAEFLGKKKPKRSTESFDAKKFMTEQDEFSAFGEDIKEDKSKRAQNSPDYVNEIFNFWQSRNLYKHRCIPKALEENLKKVLKSGYTVDDLKKAIEHYEKVNNDKNYFWNYSYTIDVFFEGNKYRKLPFEKFLDEGEHWVNYLADQKKNSNPLCFNKELHEIAKQGNDALMRKMEEDKEYLKKLLETAESI